jgi:hypothetical protein
MVNEIFITSLKKQLDEVIVHEQVENGIAIKFFLSVDHMD